LTCTVSGCIGPGGDSGPTGQGGHQAVSVEELDITPNEIFEDGTVRIRMTVRNVGTLPAELNISADSDDVKGNNVLTNHCPDIFDITDFSATSDNVSDTEPSYLLAPGYRARMNWELTQNTGNVPLAGYDCNLRFEVPFKYSVEAFRQIQIKNGSDVQGTDQLFAKSSKGPMKIELQSVGSSAPSGAPTFLQGDNADIRVQLENKVDDDDSSFTGTVELQPPVMDARNVNFSEVNVSDRVDTAERIAGRMENKDESDVREGKMMSLCPDPKDLQRDGRIRLYEGKSTVFSCLIDYDLDGAPSLRGEIFAEADYTYVKSLGSRTVKVKYRGQ
jgi:hypothetical protein